MAALAPDQAPLQLQFLGPFAAHVHGQPLAPLRTRKGAWLLALLALRAGQQIVREWLAGILWPDSQERQALANLRTSLKDLRHALGPEAWRLSAPTTRTLSLDLTGAAVDVLAFDAAITRGDPASLEAAVALYCGPLLEGCAEEWAFQERQIREQAQMGALESLAARAQSGGDLAEAEGHLRRVVSADPLRETAQRQLMQVLATEGNYAGAVRVYRDLRLRLHREVNSEPDPETITLFQRLRAAARGQPAAPPVGPRRPAAVMSGALSTALDDPERAARRAPVFPRLPRLSAFPHNLPLQLTHFVGRERELATVKDLLATHRLVTLTGVGGGGKTRLALQVAADRLSSFSDGVWLVELAPVREQALVLPAVASVFGVQEARGLSLLDTLGEFLRAKNLLLVLDNFEHVLEAAPQVQELLAEAPQVMVLATSRAPLRLQGEQEYPVPPLDVPDPKRLPPLELLSQYAAVELFCQRARDVQPDFALTRENAGAVAAVCQRLDGLPLAIILAAARMKLFSPQALRDRLKRRLPLLTGGAQDRPARHQTLRGAIAWSYDLLTEQEQSLFRRLSVFVGGCTLAAAEAVCNDCGLRIADCGLGTDPPEIRNPQSAIRNEEVLDGMAALINQSLLRQEEQEDGEPRFMMLETIREFGLESLARCSEVEITRQRHRDYFLGLAEQAETELKGPGQGEWLTRLEEEHDNLRAALDGCMERGDAEAGLRMGGVLSGFWTVRGFLTEGRERLAQVLSLPGAAARTPARGRALNGAGLLARDYQAARTFMEESLAIFQELGDQQGIARALGALASLIHFEGDQPAGKALHEATLAIYRELGDQQGIASSLGALGHTARAQGDYETARALLEESLAIFRGLGNHRAIAYALRALGEVARAQGDCEAARAYCDQSLSLGRELGNYRDIALSLSALGHVAREAGEYTRCAALYRESLALRQSRDDRPSIAQAIGDFAGLAERRRQWERAVRLLGAAESVSQTLGRSLLVAVPEEYQRTLDGARAALSEAAFAAAWAAGQIMPLEEAITVALEVADDVQLAAH